LPLYVKCKTATVLNVKLPHCVILKTATLYYTYNCHPALHVKLPLCTIRSLSLCLYKHKLNNHTSDITGKY